MNNNQNILNIKHTNNPGWDSELESTSGPENLNHQDTSSTASEINSGDFRFIGRVEWVALPEFDVKGLRAKIDTGAYSIAIQAQNIRVENSELVFNLLDESNPKYTGQDIRVSNFTTTSVKSSNGDAEVRYVIKTNLSIGGIVYEVDATLSNRKGLKKPILIGRKFLSKNRFVVDVTAKYLLKAKKDVRFK